MEPKIMRALHTQFVQCPYPNLFNSTNLFCQNHWKILLNEHQLLNRFLYNNQSFCMCKFITKRRQLINKLIMSNFNNNNCSAITRYLYGCTLSLWLLSQLLSVSSNIAWKCLLAQSLRTPHLMWTNRYHCSCIMDFQTLSIGCLMHKLLIE